MLSSRNHAPYTLLYLSVFTFAVMSCGTSTQAGDSGPSNDSASGQGCTLSDGRRIPTGTTAMVSCNTCDCTLMGLVCTRRACNDTDASVSDGGAMSCEPVVRPFSGICGASVQYPCGTPGGPVDAMVTRARCAELCVPAAMQFPQLCITDDCSGIMELNNTVTCRCGPMR